MGRGVVVDKNLRPTVTFALFAYNQERYIQDAVRGALAQDYSPLEIILSDDFSTDRTYDIIAKLAREYNGPNLVRVNRNPENLGLAEHINRVMSLATGEIIVVAAGDDVSKPERVTRLLKEFQDNPSLMAVSSKAVVINDDAQPTGEVMTLANNGSRAESFALNHCVGCSHAWRKELFDIFGPLARKVRNEDVVISSRAALLEAIAYIDDPLVDYRRHQGNTDEKSVWKRWRSLDSQRLNERKRAIETVLAYDLQRLADFQTVESRLSPARAQTIRNLYIRRLNNALKDYQLVCAPSLSQSVKTLLSAPSLDRLKLTALKLLQTRVK